MVKKSIKVKKESTLNSQRDIALGYATTFPSGYIFEDIKDVVSCLIERSIDKNIALILASGTLLSYGYIHGENDKKKYNAPIRMYNNLVKRGNSPIKSAFLTVSYFRNGAYFSNKKDPLEEAEKEYERLEKILEGII